MLIQVTSFFRDPESWAVLQRSALPDLLARIPAGDPVRVWCAGCATGQEAYTVAIVLAELLGEEELRRRVRIYATDVDTTSLDLGRRAVYDVADVADVPAELRTRYFEQRDGRLDVTPELRGAVVFGRNNLLEDPPIGRVNLIVCRNVLIYFGSEAQRSVLHRFDLALTDPGLLFLGSAEMIAAESETFRPLAGTQRLFAKHRPAQASGARISRDAMLDGQLPAAQELALTPGAGASMRAQILLDGDARLSHANDRAAFLFALGEADFGRPASELEPFSSHPELLDGVERAQASGPTVELERMDWRPARGAPQELHVQISSIRSGSKLLGASIVLEDLSRLARLEREVSSLTGQRDRALEGGVVTSAELQSSNEELQSSNEELETMNEELQATNAELALVNVESHAAAQQLGSTRERLEWLAQSVPLPLVALDDRLAVLMWNASAQDMWGLAPDQVLGREFLTLDTGLPVAELEEPLRAALTRAEPAASVLDALDRRGCQVRISVRCAPFGPPSGDLVGVTMLMVPHARLPCPRCPRRS